MVPKHDTSQVMITAAFTAARGVKVSISNPVDRGRRCNAWFLSFFSELGNMVWSMNRDIGGSICESAPNDSPAKFPETT